MRARKADKVFDPMTNGMARGAKPRQANGRGPYRTEPSAEQTITETAAATGTFSSFGRAVRAAGLMELLGGKGPFTVFAPTDDAFAKLPPAELDGLLADRPRLARLLKRHIVRDVVEAPRRGSPRVATSIDGADLTITVEDRGARGPGFDVNGAHVVKSEILASNGVIHAIDTVLMAQ